jgi:peptide/nickel transport system permease protein
MSAVSLDSTLSQPRLSFASRWTWRRLRLSPGGATGLVIISLVVLVGVFAPFVAGDPIHQDLLRRLKPPTWSDSSGFYLLGTDSLGRDILSRLLNGTRLSLAIGVSTVFLAGTIGLLLGLVAGYFGGWVESIVMRLADIQLSVPFLIVAIAMVSVLGAGIEKMILVLVLFGWVDYCRIIRAEVLSLRAREFVDAARAIGCSNKRILFLHILPNVASSMIVVATLQVARMILAEASLSFLGMGVQPPQPAWGSMVADGRSLIASAWWISTFPGLAILITVLGINFFGDWLRDVLDPTVRIS